MIFQLSLCWSCSKDKIKSEAECRSTCVSDRYPTCTAVMYNGITKKCYLYGKPDSSLLTDKNLYNDKQNNEVTYLLQ
jgi:hypothetical protein